MGFIGDIIDTVGETVSDPGSVTRLAGATVGSILGGPIGTAAGGAVGDALGQVLSGEKVSLERTVSAGAEFGAAAVAGGPAGIAAASRAALRGPAVAQVGSPPPGAQPVPADALLAIAAGQAQQQAVGALNANRRAVARATADRASAPSGGVIDGWAVTRDGRVLGGRFRRV